MSVSKSDYLKKYLSESEIKPKRRRKVKKVEPQDNRSLLIDDTIDFKLRDTKPVEDVLDGYFEEDKPTIADHIDHRPDEVKELEKYRESNRWKKLKDPNEEADESPGKRHDSDSDQTPPRRKRFDSDSDQSPPRKKRFDSDSDQSPPRRKRFDSDSDQSPPRRIQNKHKSDSDQSPPRRSKKEQSDSDQSPPRKRFDKDSDQSPPRRRKTKPRSDSDQSPPRRRTKKNSESDEISSRKSNNKKTKLATKTLSGQKAGLSTAKEMKFEAMKIRKKNAEAFNKMDDEKLGKNVATVFRDRRTGKRRDLDAENDLQKEVDAKLEKKKAKYKAWGSGLVQNRDRVKALEEDALTATKPLARYKDDVDMHAHMRLRERDGDPMAAYIQKSKKKEKVLKNIKELPTYSGPEGKPNRYHIAPGYRWDGVHRSTGFEEKLFLTQGNRMATEDARYKWSTENM